MSDPVTFDDRSTSDVVVRIRTQEGRDERLYCHSHILIEKSRYFADRLSVNWPTHQTLGSVDCVEVHCEESDFDYHISVLRLMYVTIDDSKDGIWQTVKNALSVLRVAFVLGCEQIVLSCANYLEASPWEESEEEEILRVVPGMGPLAEPILARLYPVNQTSVLRIFFSAVRFVTSSPPLPLHEFKSSVQEQLEYMITEDDDAPLITPDGLIKLEVQKCIGGLFARFTSFMENISCPFPDPEAVQMLLSYLSDILWAWQITSKVELVKEFVCSWIEISEKLLVFTEKVDSIAVLAVKIKVIDIVSKVLEVIAFGAVIIPTSRRIDMVKVWIPFSRILRPLFDVAKKGGEFSNFKIDDDLWPSLESSLVSIILTLPSSDQAEILADWLMNKHVCYPDLTEAFQVWCFRSKVSKRRLDKHIM